MSVCGLLCHFLSNLLLLFQKLLLQFRDSNINKLRNGCWLKSLPTNTKWNLILSHYRICVNISVKEICVEEKIFIIIPNWRHTLLQIFLVLKLWPVDKSWVLKFCADWITELIFTISVKVSQIRLLAKIATGSPAVLVSLTLREFLWKFH